MLGRLTIMAVMGKLGKLRPIPCYTVCLFVSSGLPSQAFEYIHYNKGLESEASYPYKAHDGTCHFNPSNVAATVASVVNITAVSLFVCMSFCSSSLPFQNDENELYNAVGNIGPVSIAYDVAADFRFYKKGVYSRSVIY